MLPRIASNDTGETGCELMELPASFMILFLFFNKFEIFHNKTVRNNNLTMPLMENPRCVALVSVAPVSQRVDSDSRTAAGTAVHSSKDPALLDLILFTAISLHTHGFTAPRVRAA